MMYKTSYILLVLMASCGTLSTTDTPATDNKKTFEQTVNYVDTIHLRRGSFRAELISNGKLRAEQKSDLKFSGQGVVDVLDVSNGQSVSKGDRIASLDSGQLKLQLEQATQRLAKAKIELQDALLGFGYTGHDTTSVTEEHMANARLRSGYDGAVADMKIARMNLENATLTAPFAGKIANLQTKKYENPKGDFFCSVINDLTFDVEFAVLESELKNIRVGQGVTVATFTNPLKKHRGVIKFINPMVDVKGQIMITATIQGAVDLMDGMNVKAYVENIMSNQLVVPKSAVLIRDNLEVLFRMNTDGKAMWTYVNIVAANSDQYVVQANQDRGADLSAGDIIIIGGNLNLADNVSVEVK